MKNSIQLTQESTISYHYKPERDELTVQLRPVRGTTRAEPMPEREHVALQREEKSGEIVGFTISSVQQMLLEQLVRTIAAEVAVLPHAAPEPIPARGAHTPVAPPRANTDAPREEAMDELEAVVAHPAPVETQSDADAGGELAALIEGGAPPALPEADAKPAKKSRSRRKKPASAAPAPEVVAEADAATGQVAADSAESAPEADATPEADTPPEAEAKPAKQSRSRRKKAADAEAVAAAAPAESTQAATAEPVAEVAPEVEAKPAADTPPAKKSRSRRKKAASEPVTPSPTLESVIAAESAPEGETPLETDTPPDAEASVADEPTPAAESDSSDLALLSELDSEDVDSVTDAPQEGAQAAEPAATGEESASRKRRKRRKRRNGKSSSEAVAPVAQAAPEARPDPGTQADPAPHGARHTHYATTIQPSTRRSSYKSEPIEGLDAPDEFLFMGLDPLVGQALHALGYEAPTAIQRRAVPEAMQKRDIVGLAQTGTGKTLAFLLPSLHHMLRNPGSGRPRMLVLTPTRELAAQVATEAEYVATHTDFSIAAIYGQEDIGRQIRQLREGVDLVVATPGRLIDHMNRGTIKLNSVEILVLDEADRMLDMGFLPDVRRILSRVPAARQTMMFSATMPQAVQTLSLDFQREPVLIEVARQLPPSQIDQQLYPVERHLKVPLLEHLLKADKGMRSVMIFTETKAEADIVHRKLKELGQDAVIMHGDISQRERERALGKLRNGEVRMLVATNVAARGLDLPDVTHVINYEVPQTVDDYVHRIGRTARGEGAEGTAMTFMSSGDEGMIMRIESALERSLPRVYAEGFNYDVPTPSWAKPSADDIAASLSKPKNLAERFGRMMRRR